MIIWGSLGREIVQARGSFPCPQCCTPRDYRKVRVATYFTLYFIPLFETQHHGDYIECLSCQGQFKPEVLDSAPPPQQEQAETPLKWCVRNGKLLYLGPTSQAEQVVLSIQAELKSGTPVQMACTKLTNAGIEAEVAEKLVAAAAGDNQHTCSRCQLNFVSCLSRCSLCGDSLSAETRIRA